jgi:hypothetical protein
MKKFLSILLLVSITLAFGHQQASAQTFLNVNGDQRLHKTIVTTDSTLTYIDEIKVGANETGLLEVHVVGYAADTAHGLTGVKKVRYTKRGGTLTLGSVIDEQAVVTDTPLGTATFDLVAASNKIYVRVKGKAATTIRWYSVTSRKAVRL